MGREHLANIAHIPESRVVSLVDPNSGSLELAAQVHGGESQTFSNLHDALSGPEFDVVVIASPNNTHAGVIHEALEHGKHVLVEKPAARNAAELLPRLATLLGDQDTGRSDEMRAAARRWEDGIAQMYLELERSMTREQRQRAQTRLRRFADDFNRLAIER